VAIKSFRDLEVYQLAHKAAMAIFKISKNFPSEEKYSLTDQIRRSSRSVAVNIAEGWGKRIYENNFKRHLVDSQGSLEETKAWLLFATDCSYINEKEFTLHWTMYEELGSKIFNLHDKWRTFN
jgi:four helix bundle protein